ncbi:MAG TPA: C-GCAxxG-C-C family protein [Candidatus Gastranaerophilales bacterium]|nr:C-GCAxxG-C-C family protein [Candidatus Gastranaerophilales bacterium]
MENKICFKQKAVELFTKGHSCSESIIRSAYDCGIIDNNADLELLYQIASPFSGEAKATGCICGSLVGAQMIVGCLIGRKDITYPNDRLKQVSQRIVQEFKEKGHVTCCRAYLENYNETSDEKYEKCVQTIGDVIEILYENLLKDIKFKTDAILK